MVRRRSRSTLFPYTTLFRSRAFLVEGEDIVAEFAGLSRATRRGVLRIEIKRHPFALVIGERMPLAVLVLQAEDRKSTRLNSSHSQISYAVFCSKKKSTLACH